MRRGNLEAVIAESMLLTIQAHKTTLASVLDSI